MTEIYDFRQEGSTHAFFNHLLLGSEVRKLTKECPDFDSSKLEISLTVNGVNVLIKDFNEVLEDWGDRIERQIKDNLEYFSGEEAVTRKAEKLIQEKLGNVREFLDDIENSMWKLEE